jgi:hypothetical protein
VRVLTRAKTISVVKELRIGGRRIAKSNNEILPPNKLYKKAVVK